MQTHSTSTFASASAAAHRHFLVGQDRAGRWVALETHGLGSGMFRSRQAAVSYAHSETDRRPGSVEIANQPVEFRL